MFSLNLLFKLKNQKLLPKSLTPSIDVSWKRFLEEYSLWCYASEEELERIQELCKLPKTSNQDGKTIVVMGEDSEGSEYDYAMENITSKGIYEITFLNPDWKDLYSDGWMYLLDCRGCKIKVTLMTPEEFDLCPTCLGVDCTCDEDE